MDACSWKAGIGSFSDSAILSAPSLTTLEECAALCAARTDCKAVVVSPSSWQVFLHKVIGARMFH